MPDRFYECHGVGVLEWDADGPQPRGDRDVVDLIGSAGQHDARWVALHAARLGDPFFQLKTRIAGEILQKFVTYRLSVAIVGDISRQLSESSALRDFVQECNRGSAIWFVDSMEAFESRLEQHVRA